MDRARSAPAWMIRAPAIGDVPGWTAPAMAVALAAFLFLAFGTALFGCGDTDWHLAAGEWIIAHRAVPHVDPFSFTFAGRPWVAHEWLAELTMAAAFNAGSWNALAVMFGALFAAILLVVGESIGRHLPPAAVAAALALVTSVLTPAVLARPHLIGWLLLAAWLALLLRARDADRAPPPAAALMMLLWANCHASFLFGLALAAAIAGEALLARPRWEVLRGWTLFGIVAVAAALATPHGIHGLLFPIQLSGMRTLPLITEWLPTNFADQPGFPLLLAVGGYLVATRRVRVPAVRALIVLATLVMALEHARHQAIFAIVATMLLARPIGEALPARTARSGRRAGPTLAALIACFAVAATVRLAVPAAERDSATRPATMLAGLPPALLHLPVFNDYGFGGTLIRRGIAPFIDGRADMYGDAFVAQAARISGGDIAAFRRAAARYRIGWTILPPASPLAAALDREPGWRRLRTDAWATVHVRTRGAITGDGAANAL